MKKTIVSLVAVLFLSASCDQSHLQQQAQVPVGPGLSPWDRDLLSGGESNEKSGAKLPARNPVAQIEAPKDAILEGRKKLIPAISATFQGCNSGPEVLHWFMPFESSLSR